MWLEWRIVYTRRCGVPALETRSSRRDRLREYSRSRRRAPFRDEVRWDVPDTEARERRAVPGIRFTGLWAQRSGGLEDELRFLVHEIRTRDLVRRTNVPQSVGPVRRPRTEQPTGALDPRPFVEEMELTKGDSVSPS